MRTIFPQITTSRAGLLLATGGLLAGLSGCGDNVAKEVAAMNTSNVQRLSNTYAAFQNFKGGRGPNDAADFKAFIKDFDPNKLSMMGIDPKELDAIFTSERDGKPFKIRYKVGGGRGSVDPVVFEQDGKEGKKQVGFTGGKVEDVDDATYAQLWAGKGEKPTGDPRSGGRPVGAPAGAPTGPPGK
jgi:hypothetical protein